MSIDSIAGYLRGLGSDFHIAVIGQNSTRITVSGCRSDDDERSMQICKATRTEAFDMASKIYDQIVDFGQLQVIARHSIGVTVCENGAGYTPYVSVVLAPEQ